MAKCGQDADGCPTQGTPIYWPSDCSWFGVQEDGSPKRSVTYDTFHTLVKNAFAKWANADCGGGLHPSFEAQDTDALYGPAVCDQAEFNQKAPNANVWMFRDSTWPYANGASTIALTTLTIEVASGKIRDADVEVNSAVVDVTTSDTSVGADLDSIVTHESGHFLGLAHSLDPTATMYANYSPQSISIRTLAPDDIEGICGIYPPAAAPTCGEPDSISGFSRYCGGVNPSTLPVSTSTVEKGCSCRLSRATSSPWGLLAIATTLLAASFRRRKGQTAAR
jgi:hypothetical protein